jgi:hypothetical protein
LADAERPEVDAPEEDPSGEHTGSDAGPEWLSPWIRVALGGVGAALLGVTAYIAFVSHNGTATAALVGVGLVLAVLAVMGRPIRRFRYGDVEVELLQRAKAEAARGNTERARELVGAALTSAGLPSEVAVHSAGRLHEAAVLGTLRRVLPMQAEVRLTAAPTDGEIHLDGEVIGVETRLGLRTLQPLKERLAGHKDTGKLDVRGLLVVVRGRGTDERAAHAERVLADALEIPVRVVRWREGDAEDLLVEAFDDLVGSPRRSQP